MKKLVLLFVIIVHLSSRCFAQIPASLGWYSIPGTSIDSVCSATHGFPEVSAGASGGPVCQAVTNAWNSGVYDPVRNRLIVWGGGHADWFGNEIYAVNLNSLTVSMLTNPTLPVAGSGQCPSTLGSDPNSVHTYDGIAYMANVDRMFAFGGSKARCGFLSNTTATFSFANNSWTVHSPSGPIPASDAGIVTAYDANTGLVFIHDSLNLYSYNFSTNAYARLSNNSVGVDYHLTAEIDPVNKRLVMIGNNQAWVYDIAPGSSYVKQALSSSGGSWLISQSSPGLTFDSSQGKLVGWQGGNAVYTLTFTGPSSGTWVTQTFSDGPNATTGNGNGTYGRFAYVPGMNLFAVVNFTSANAYTLRVNSGGGPPPTLPVVSIVATDASASEVGPDSGTFTVSRSGSTAGSLVVSYSLGGTAVAADYATLSGSLTIPVGAASANVVVTPVDDGVPEGTETVVATISANANYTVGSPSSDSISIADSSGAPSGLIASDDFNRANGPVGSNWQYIRETTWQGNPPSVVSNVVNASASGAHYQVLRWNGAGVFTDNQSATVKIGGLGYYGSDYRVGVVVRCSADLNTAADYYAYWVQADAPTSFTSKLVKVVNGVESVLNSSSVSWVNGDTEKLEVEGSTLRVIRNTTQILSLSDNSITTGKPGFLIAGSGAVPNLDNWEGRNIGLAPPPPPNAPPTITIVSPANNAGFIAPASVTFTVTANDDVSVSKVDFYSNSTLIGTSSTAPFGFNWGNVLPGAYSVTAKATDNLGLETTSSPVSISVCGCP